MNPALIAAAVTLAATAGYLYAENRRLTIQAHADRVETQRLAAWVRDAREAVAHQHSEVLDDLVAAWRIPTIRHESREDAP